MPPDTHIVWKTSDHGLQDVHFSPRQLSVLFLYAVAKQISWSERGEEIQLAATPCWPPCKPIAVNDIFPLVKMISEKIIEKDRPSDEKLFPSAAARLMRLIQRQLKMTVPLAFQGGCIKIRPSLQPRKMSASEASDLSRGSRDTGCAEIQ